MLSDLSTGSQTKFQSILETYTKILSSGKASSREIMSLANQGLPIREELKKMGVTGSASANQIIKAFQEMTKEGGKFYQSSEKGNDTITGKTAYFVDTMKELKVSFAEVFGIADAYKGILEKANEFIQGIVDDLGQLKKYKDAGLSIWSILFPDEEDKKVIGKVNFLNLDYDEQLKTFDSEIARLSKEADDYEKRIAELREMVSNPNYKKYTNKKTQDTTLQNISNLKLEKDNTLALIVDYEKQKKALLEQGNQTEDESGEKTRKKIEEVKTSWRELWKSVTGVKLEDEDNGIIAGNKTVDRIAENIKDKLSVENLFKGNGVVNTASIYEEQLSRIKNNIQTLLNNKDIDDPFTLEDNGIQKLIKKYQELEKAKEKALITDVENKNNAYKKILNSVDDIKERYVQIYALEHNISDESARNYLNIQNENNELMKQVDLTKKIAENLADKDFKSYLENQQLLAGKNGNMAGYTGLGLVNGAINSSGDAKNFLQGMQVAGPIGGAINAVISSLSQVANSVEGMDKVLNPITTLMETMKPLFELIVGVFQTYLKTLEKATQVISTIVEGILRPFAPILELITGLFDKLGNFITEMFDSVQPLLDIVMLLIDTILNAVDTAFSPLIQVFRLVGTVLKTIYTLLQPMMAVLNTLFKLLTLVSVPIRMLTLLFEWLMNVLKAFFKPFLDKLDELNNWVDNFMGNRKEEEEQKKNMIESYKKLLNAMKEQEEWYLRNKTALIAGTRVNSYSVNDMILTPKGTFSTHPDDTIIAMKHPEQLGGNRPNVNFIVNNTMADTVEVSTEQTINDNGDTEIAVRLSRLIANDVANGNNGWDSALSARSTRLAGRRVSL